MGCGPARRSPERGGRGERGVRARAVAGSTAPREPPVRSLRKDYVLLGFHQALAAELTPVEGIVDSLDALTRLPTCVASSGSHDKMRFTLGMTGLHPRFEGRIFSATEVEHGKPAPDLFLHAAREMGIAPAACAVVEDSQYGLRAARAAGMRAFAYAGGLTPADRLEGPDTVVFDDMRRLPGLLADH
ncbi:HAD-IA family hydrolase [Streptomyces sp. NPDC059171]|uniref:HAD-IA family hydrolase n=1 Tax=Streptomyces sp. NPDC059171 TaxID=3346755 RepID=UPI00367F66D2